MPDARVPADVIVRFVSVDDALPPEWKECLIYVDFDDDDPAIFYGMRRENKWIGAMPWDSCGDGSGYGCVGLAEIGGEVVSWAPFPKTGAMTKELKNAR